MRQLGTASIGLALSIILVCALVNSTEKGRLPRGPSSSVSPSVSSSLANSAELNHGYLNVRGPADAGLNNLEWSASSTESKLQFLYPVQQDCCDCDPTASDAQCFAQCNAMLPRCRPPAPRAPSPPSAPAPATALCKSALTGFCCAGNLRYYSAPSQGLICPGAPCYLIVRNWTQLLREPGRGCW